MDKLIKAATMDDTIVADLTHLEWIWYGVSKGSNGTLPKAIDWNSNPRQFYKASKYNMADGFIGDEIKPVPLFDNGYCMFANCMDESKFSLFKYEDPYTNSIFGYMKHSQLLNKFKPYISMSSIDKNVSINWDYVFLNISRYLSKVHIDFIIELVEYRLSYVRSLL